MRRWALGFIAGVLGCASSGTPPVGAPLQVWARAEVGQGCEPDAEDRCVATLCTETECALFFCEDLAPAGIVRTRASAPVFVAPGGTAQRNWGSAQGLPGDRQPVMVFRGYPRERLPSEVRRQQAMEEWARRPKEKHHLFPQQYTAYFLAAALRTGLEDDPAVRPVRADDDLLAEHRAGTVSHGRLMRYFELRTPHYEAPRIWTGSYQADARWMLPGVECPTCGETWSGIALSYPSVDLSQQPLRTELETPHLVPFERYARLLEQVRTWLPPGAQLEPGTTLGPLVGTAEGTFGPLVLRDPWKLLVRADALDTLRAAGLQGLVPVRAELTARGASIPALHELELAARGRLYPPGPSPCETCGRVDATMPEECRLEGASLPADLDVFRLTDAVTMIVATEHFVEVARGLGPVDVLFREIPVSGRR